MKKLTLILLLLPTIAWGAGPIYQHKDALNQQEFENIYHDLSRPVTTTAVTSTSATYTTVAVSSEAIITGDLVLTGIGGNRTPVSLLDTTNNEGGYIGLSSLANLADFIISANRKVDGTIRNTGQAVSQIQLESGPANANLTFYTSATNNTAPTLRFTIDKNGVATFTGQLIGNGTATNDSAAAGQIGQYVSATASGNFPATDTYGDAASISLTAGDWDVSTMLNFTGATVTGIYFVGGIGTATGNNGAGISQGTSAAFGSLVSGKNDTVTVPRYRASLSGTTTLYFKVLASYTAGTPAYGGMISARRAR